MSEMGRRRRREREREVRSHNKYFCLECFMVCLKPILESSHVQVETRMKSKNPVCVCVRVCVRERERAACEIINQPNIIMK